MTTEELRRMDFRIAKEVMGDWYESGPNVWFSKDGSTISCEDDGPKYYSSRPQDMQSLLNHLWATGNYGEIEIRRYTAYANGEPCVMATLHRKNWTCDWGYYCKIVRLEGACPEAEALCLAAIKELEEHK